MSALEWRREGVFPRSFWLIWWHSLGSYMWWGVFFFDGIAVIGMDVAMARDACWFADAETRKEV